MKFTNPKNQYIMNTTYKITYKRAGKQDSAIALDIFARSILDFEYRSGYTPQNIPPDQSQISQTKEFFRSIFDHLGRTADQFWLAAVGGRTIGYARSILRDGFRELTDFFVLPGEQSSGVGSGLITRAFPAENTRGRSIIATTDVRAQVAYLKKGVYPITPVYYFGRSPEYRECSSDLIFHPASITPENMDAIKKLDIQIIGFRRDVDHEWLLNDRQGFLYLRDDNPVGYGYVGKVSSGPIALLDCEDFPAVLAHAESYAAFHGFAEFGLQVPLVNRWAVDYLLAFGYRVNPFLALLMLDGLHGKFENYILTSPVVFI